MVEDSEKSEQPSWTSEQKNFLAQEEFITEVLKRRKVPEEERHKSWFQKILDSPGATAIISALIGGLLSLSVAYLTQRAQAEKDYQEQFFKLRSEQALTERKDYLEREKQVVTNIHDLIGNSISATDALLSQLEFNKDIDRENTESQQESRRVKFNTNLESWQSERIKVTLQVSYYYSHQAGVVNAWNNTQGAVTGYMDCVSKLNLSHQQGQNISEDKVNSCKMQREAMWRHINAFSGSLGGASESTWERLLQIEK